MLNRNVSPVPAYPREFFVERQQQSFPFEQELAVLRKRWRLIGFVTFVCGIAGLAVALVNPAHYAGRVQFEVDHRAMQMRQQNAVYLESAVTDAIVESQVEILKSEPLASAVIKQLNLTEDPEFVPPQQSIRDLLAGITGLAILGADRLIDPHRTAVQSFRSALSVHRVGMSHIVEVRFLSDSAVKSAEIANALAEAYLKRQARQRAIAASSATGWLRKQAEQAGIRSTVLTRAEPPSYPSGVSSKVVVGGFLVLGACLGSGLALLLEATRRRVRSRKDIIDHLALNCVGVLPRVSGSRRIDWSRDNPFHRRSRAFSHVAHHCRLSCMSFNPRETIRTIGVTSCAKRNGKTVVATNLAAVFAQAGSKVLLINASGPSPMQGRDGDASTVWRLPNMLEDFPLAQITREVDGFSFLSLTDLIQEDGQPLELVCTSKMNLLLLEALSDYDVIIFDLPPLRPSPDVRASAVFIDAFLLVIAQGEKSEPIRQALDEIDEVGEKVAGAVLNKGVRL